MLKLAAALHTIERMKGDCRIKEDFKRSGRELTAVLSHHFPEGTEVNH
jgi:hypothetical protein